MARLVWDGTGERFYENGVDRGVLFKKGVSGYETGVAWNGLTAVNESHEGGDKNDIWADNIKYLSMTSQERFSGTIEAYTYPEEFSECDGSIEIAEGVYAAQQPRKEFGFVYRTMIGNDAGQEYYKLHIVYNAKAEASDVDNSTMSDSPDAKTFSWNFSTFPEEIGEGYKPTAHLVIDSRYADSTKLRTLENMIYGADADSTASPAVTESSPTLPDPATVISTMGAVSNG